MDPFHEHGPPKKRSKGIAAQQGHWQTPGDDQAEAMSSPALKAEEHEQHEAVIAPSQLPSSLSFIMDSPLAPTATGGLQGELDARSEALQEAANNARLPPANGTESNEQPQIAMPSSSQHDTRWRQRMRNLRLLRLAKPDAATAPSGDSQPGPSGGSQPGPSGDSQPGPSGGSQPGPSGDSQPGPDKAPQGDSTTDKNKSNAQGAPTRRYPPGYRRTFCPSRLLSFRKPTLVEKQMRNPTKARMPVPIGDAWTKIQNLEDGSMILSQSVMVHQFDRNFIDFTEQSGLDESVWCFEDGEGSRLTPTQAETICHDACFYMDLSGREKLWEESAVVTLLRHVFDGRSHTPHAIDWMMQLAGYFRSYLEPEPTSESFDEYILNLEEFEDVLCVSIPSLSRKPARGIHKTWVPVPGCAIAFSTSSARTGLGMTNGVLRVANWHNAYWERMRYMLSAKLRLLRDPNSMESDLESLTREEFELVDEQLKELGALHGIVVEGHAWYYVASSPRYQMVNGKPSKDIFVWLEQSIGRTDSAFGVQKIASFLEYLKSWETNHFAPWFARHGYSPFDDEDVVRAREIDEDGI